MDIATTEELIAKAKTSDQSALDQLFQQLREPLLRWVSKGFLTRTRANYNPSDVIQETFIKASRGISNFRGVTQEEFRSWLQKISTNLIKDFEKMSKTKRDAICLDMDIPSEAPSRLLRDIFIVKIPEAPKKSSQADTSSVQHISIPVEKLLQCYESLNDPEKQVIQLYYIEEPAWTDRRIAIELHRTEEGTRKIRTRALHKMREKLVDSQTD